MGSPAIFNGSRTKLLTSNGLLLGSGMTVDYDGNVNYVANSGFEINVTGYAAYADAAGTSPVNGTGGSPTVTITRTTSSPLMQTASGLFTKDAANRQGEGFSYDFTIDSGVAAQGLPCTIQAYYKIASGTYASGDMTVWIYDVTNSVVIQPSASSILNASVPQNIQCEFQPAVNSTSYRLIFHVTTTSASAYTLQFDNIRVSPNTYNPGSALGEWLAYPANPTFVGFGTATTISFFYKRKGDSMDIRGIFTAGTTTATPCTFTLPTGLSIDTSKYPTSTAQVVGYFQRAISTGTAVKTGTLIAATAGGSTIGFSFNDYTTAVNPTTSTNGDTLFSTGQIIEVRVFDLPITGWSTTQVLSSDTDTRVVAAVIGGSPANAYTANNPIIYPTVTSDTHGGYNASTGRYTIPVPGYYQIAASVYANYAIDTALSLYVDGSAQAARIATALVANRIMGGQAEIYLNAGQIVDIRASANWSATQEAGRFTVSRLSGPAQVAASESVNARYYASATSISGSLATIVWTTKDFDSHNAMASGIYTIPSPGKYQVNGGLLVAGTIALNTTCIMEIQKNGTVVSRNTEYAGGAMTDQKGWVNDIISCIAGDTIRIQLSSSATLPTIVSSNFDNYFSIARVGN